MSRDRQSKQNNMSFQSLKKVISEGDTVILFFRIDKLVLIEVNKLKKSRKGNEVVENIYQTPYGAIRPTELVGRKYGEVFKFGNGGWAYLLQPTPDLWTKILPHRTQIIYGPDISLILLHLGIKPNSVIVEAGTGSGSVSHAFINCIKPHGKLYTYDYHQDRADTAKLEFEAHGLTKWVECRKSDVLKEGFPGIDEAIVDGVFLDLPQPWTAIPFAVKILKSTGSKMVCFSPCIEQVQATVETLAKFGFYDIKTFEILQTTFNVYRKNEKSLNLKPLCQRYYDGSSELGSTVIDKGLVHRPAPMQQTGHSGYLTAASYSLGIFEESNADLEENGS